MGTRAAESGLSDITLLWMMQKARGFGLDITPPPVVRGQRKDLSPGESAEVEVDPEPMLRLHASRKSFYRLFKPVSRPMGTSPSGHERLSSSAFDRHKKDTEGYHPANLMAYLDSPGGPDIARV